MSGDLGSSTLNVREPEADGFACLRGPILKTSSERTVELTTGGAAP